MTLASSLIPFNTLLWRECHRFLRLANQTLIPPLITVILFILIFGYSLGSRINDIHGIPYMHFLIPGLVMMSVINNAFANTSNSLYISRFQGNIQELLVSSMSNFEIVLAIILGGVFRGLMVGLLVILSSCLLTHIPIQHPAITFFLILNASLLFSCAGFLSAMWAQDFDRLSMFQNYLLMPLTYLGGVFFSVDMLPPFWQHVALANPILYFVNSLRYSFLGFSDIPVWETALIGLALSFLLFYLCYRLFQRGYNIKT